MGAIILFDGVCNFCDKSVQFILKRDRKGYFRFAPIQSEIGQKLIRQHHVSLSTDSLVLIEEGRVFLQSTAALKICRQLDYGWPICYMAIIVPPFIRNHCYQAFAKRRYQWFGRKEECRLPTREEKQRFL